MKRIIGFLLLIIITSACGNTKPNTHSDQQKPEPANGNSENTIVTGRIETSLSTEQMGHNVTLVFTIKNQTEQEITFKFNTSQRYDIEINDTSGKVVYRYSDHTFFGQALGEFTLKQGEERSFDTTVKDLEPGQYSVTFWLTDNEHQPKATKAMTIE